jgi:hypothetical protein
MSLEIGVRPSPARQRRTRASLSFHVPSAREAATPNNPQIPARSPVLAPITVPHVTERRHQGSYRPLLQEARLSDFASRGYDNGPSIYFLTANPMTAIGG